MSRDNHVQAIVEILVKLQKPSVKGGWKKLGLSHAQMGMLYLLSFHEQTSVNQTADFLGVSKSAVTQLADSLEDKGLISRTNDNKDRRIVRLSLTAEGRQIMKKLARHKYDGVRAGLEKLTDKEVEQFYGLTLKMTNK
ncbi:MAG TPA: MarR family transcriptional regulator [Candidatus Saccharimonadales bacterium]|nr:MarR family transcriptional regulator [Candidatus Saccharimonadales bacterium]